MPPTTKIERLTPDQESQLAPWRDQWLTHGLSTDRADRPRAEAGVRAAYDAAGLTPPSLFIWLDSPMAGAYGAAILADKKVWAQVGAQVRAQVRAQVGDQVRAQVGDQVWDQVWAQVGDQVGDQVGAQVWAQVRAQVGDQVRAQVRDQVWAQVYKSVWGQHDAGWVSFYDYMHNVVGIDQAAKLHGVAEVAKSSGWWWPFAGAVILTERPTGLHRDAENRLHAETGPALAYPDGWSIYAWHGVRVPAWVITGPTVELIHAEENAEIRRCAIEHLGWDRYIDQAHLSLTPAVADPGNPGQTLALSQPLDLFGTEADELVRVLLCTNGTVERDGVRRRFGLTVPASIGDPVAAAAWGYGWPVDVYRRLQRRT